ncbi:MAG: glycerol-3-phosphate dehydrogenase/oxidase [Deltaproteobacteria bacterium]|nr:glycerol-3-phosphate dehydrogenase/oxidase [Deltaproteobacteria bacterium]
MEQLKRKQLRDRCRSDVFDIIIVGGGISGAGIAREAASRGYSILLLERKDFASGASSRSGKLIHGGFRYLKHMRFRWVHISCRERDLLCQKLAPGLVFPIKFVLPFFRNSRTPKWIMRVGTFLYSLLQWPSRLGGCEVWSKHRLGREFPQLAKENNKGAVVFSDCLTNDARLTLEVIKTVSYLGGQVCNYSEVKAIQKHDNLWEFLVYDNLEGLTWTVRSRVAINSAGPWVNEILKRADRSDLFQLKHSKGVHLAFSSSRINIRDTLALEVPQDGRFVYLIPFPSGVWVGTTDNFYEGDLDAVRVVREDVDYLLGVLNHYFPDAHLGIEDILSAEVGIRPLIGGELDEASSQASRDWEVKVSDDGFLSVTGGKLTTFRAMAVEALTILGKTFPMKLKPSRTYHSLSPLIFAFDQKVGQKEFERLGLESEMAQVLSQRYGAFASKLMRILEKDASKKERLIDTPCHILAELDYFMLYEHAETLSDILMRRTQIYMFSQDHGLSILDRLGQYVANFKNWDDARLSAETKAYRQELERLSIPCLGQGGGLEETAQLVPP